MGFFATSAAFALGAGMFYAYVQSSTPRERRSYVQCARASRANDCLIHASLLMIVCF
jgi:hypothetical protein